jgi:hypothetical protein
MYEVELRNEGGRSRGGGGLRVKPTRTKVFQQLEELKLVSGFINL